MRKLTVLLAVLPARRALLILGLTLALTAALWPQPARAECDLIRNGVGCFVDEGIVSLLRFLAQLGWFFNGNLLLVSRWIEEQRNWLINDVMAAVFEQLLRGASVAWAQAVVIAVVVFIIGYSLRAVAELNWVDLRRGLRNGLFALVVFTYGAQLMAGSENFRLALSQAAGQAATDALTTAGAARMLTGPSSNPGDLMAPVATVYPGEKCGGIVPARATAVVMINDVAANYLFATAEDIHCTAEAGTSANAPALPRVFWEGGEYPVRSSMGESSGTVNFVGFYSETPGEAVDSTDRARIVSLAMAGAIRQLFGLFLTIAAVLEQIIQMMFALGLVALWFSLSISLVFALFVPTEGMLAGILRTGIALFKTSVLTTIGVTLVAFVIRTVAASSSVNAGLVAFIGLIALVLLILLMVNAGRSIFLQVSSMSSATLGAAPAAVMGTLAGAGMVAGMALRGADAGSDAAVSARERAERDALRSGASEQEAKQAGNRAARAAYMSALGTSAKRTFNDVSRMMTDVAGVVDDPLKQSMRWQDRAEDAQRQKDTIAAMDRNDEQREENAKGDPERPAAGRSAEPGTERGSSTAQRLRGLPPASPANPYTSTTMALDPVGQGQRWGAPIGKSTDAVAAQSSAERAADAEVTAAQQALERAQQELTDIQQQLARTEARAAVEKPSAANEREIRRLTKESEGVISKVARLRDQLDEAKRIQGQVQSDRETTREQAESSRTWGMVQATEGQRNDAGVTPQLAIRSGIGLAQQQLDREQQQLARRPADEPGVAEDRAWLQQQQAAVGSLRRWNETLARPDVSPTDRAAGEAAIRTIREDAEREQRAAREQGNQQREQIAGGVSALAGAILPAAPAGTAPGAVVTQPTASSAEIVSVPTAVAQGASSTTPGNSTAPTPAGTAQEAAAPHPTASSTGAIPIPATAVQGAAAAAPQANGGGDVPVSRAQGGTVLQPTVTSVAAPGAGTAVTQASPGAPGITSSQPAKSTLAERLQQPASPLAPAVTTAQAPIPASTTAPVVSAPEVALPVGDTPPTAPGAAPTAAPLVEPGVPIPRAAPIASDAPGGVLAAAAPTPTPVVAPAAPATSPAAAPTAAPDVAATTVVPVAAPPASATSAPGTGVVTAPAAPVAGAPAAGAPPAPAAPVGVSPAPVVSPVAPAPSPVPSGLFQPLSEPSAPVIPGNTAPAQLGSARNVSPTVPSEAPRRRVRIGGSERERR